MKDSASGTRLPGRLRARWSNRSTPTPSMITTSASSPRASRAGIASGESPTEGPRVVMSLWPVDFSNAGPSSEYTLKKPAEIITLTSAAEAAPQISTTARKTKTLMIKACGTSGSSTHSEAASVQRKNALVQTVCTSTTRHRFDRARTTGRGCSAAPGPAGSTHQFDLAGCKAIDAAHHFQLVLLDGCVEDRCSRLQLATSSITFWRMALSRMIPALLGRCLHRGRQCLPPETECVPGGGLLSFRDLIVASTAPQLSCPRTRIIGTPKHGDAVFHARHRIVVGEIAGHAADEQVTPRAIEGIFGCDARMAQLRTAA